ncbi:MAG: hypothetical protein R6V14_04465 [Halanaerobiales bacterium]
MVLTYDPQMNSFLVEVKKKSNLFYQIISKKSFSLLKEKKQFVIGLIEYEDLKFDFFEE